MKKISLLVVAGILSGCAGGMEIAQEPVNVNINPNSAGRIVDYEQTVVRTFATAPQRAEISGVPCRLAAQSFSAEFTTPAIINMPDFGHRSEPANVRCDYQGKTATGTLTPHDVTAENNSAVGFGAGGILGMIIAEAVISASSPENHDFAYRNLSVEFD